ncbi:uncharacterized protein LOC116841397 [Odontomachus brunneus]|uniref:uncharacterized protein LOC116841397 n=1 Tax=Odontomachus brunneus TaxID=486640 RepID=UPI0013F1B364|nr:uncharacterized protein LOC116841397 [Odontomachus brunneus]
MSRNDNTALDQQSISVLRIGRCLLKICPSSMETVFDFVKKGNDKFSINFPTYHQANEFISLVYKNRFSVRSDECWVAYVPSFKIFKKVILRGLDDSDLEPDFIAKHLRPAPDHFEGQKVHPLSALWAY